MSSIVKALAEILYFEYVIGFPIEPAIWYGLLDQLCWITSWIWRELWPACLIGACLSVNLCINCVSANKNVAELCGSIVQIMI
jgi:hypothetical protein